MLSDIEDGIRRFKITSPQWGEIDILRPLPDSGGPWGVLACLKGTPYEELIPVVTGEDLSHALHGRATPLMRAIGRPPERLIKMIPEGFQLCQLADTCIMYDRKACFPGPKTPLCFEAPGMDTETAQMAATVVVQAWKDGRYVLVAEGDEFSL